MKWFPWLLFLILAYPSHGQNLVPNPSFETYLNCPYAPSTIVEPSGIPSTVQSWFKATIGTADYLHACAPSGSMSVPNNLPGWQMARTGDAYTGGFMLSSNPALSREYIQALLTVPMIQGHEYLVSFWVSLAENSPGSLVATDQIGAYFDTGYIFSMASGQLDFLTPQVLNPPGIVLGDTSNWMQVQGTYTASGGERCIVIGNFSSFSNQSLYPIIGDTLSFSSYYYIDDICVFDMADMQAVHDTTICGYNQLTLSGRDGMHSYIWNTGDTSENLVITQPGTYWVKAFADCIAAVDTFHISVTDFFIDLGADTGICTGGTLLLDATIDSANYIWQDGSTMPTYNVSEEGVYFVSVTKDECIFKDTIRVSIIEPSLDITPQDTLICAGTLLEVEATANPVSWFLWSNGSTTDSILVSEPGTYTVIATNICGTFNDEVTITTEHCNCSPFVPNAFSPNGDKKNELLEVILNCPGISDYVFSIYNRYGQRIFHADTPEKGWDGTFNGKRLDIGTYFYYLKFKGPQGYDYKKKGDIILLR